MKPSDEIQKPIRLMAAACRNMGIGKDGRLPWNLPPGFRPVDHLRIYQHEDQEAVTFVGEKPFCRTEFQFFLNTVTTVCKSGKKNLIIWGKCSWFSCPESVFPLANSLNVVLSKKLMSVPKHAHYVCEEFVSAVKLASHPPLGDLVETIWVLGGTRVYKEAVEHPWCDLIYLTDIMADFDCDVFFPSFDQNVFRIQYKFPGVPDEIQEENGIKFRFQVFRKQS